ncbi:hypothetical protein SBOR_4337 [Sclerotinia borealis F-4128]|uniref:Major facilitator superfamily (MFS) profile domain-containing protein n=1 Tax=Sclerotinia borealis (strain F-4128) TaxID=1432307 RepID=W9CH53_SCLBF|nr:hypothetical protein SBOR_4337 [Sclerotinia borealis F-4128]
MTMDQSNNDSGGKFETPSESERQTSGHTSRNSSDNPHSFSHMGDLLEEAPEVRIERLGRQRPEVFKSIWAEIGFVFSISMSQVLTEYFVSGFTVILPTLVKSLDIPSASATWPASAFSLTLACFLLVFGRLSDMYGGYPAYVAGFVWLALWSLVGGFSTNLVMLNFCRALQGLGPAMYLPSSVALIGIIYRPGPRKNLIFSIYGACAPLGFFVGIFFAGLVAEYTHWGWWFWIGCFLAAITAITSYLTIPSDIVKKRKVRKARKGTDDQVNMDWWGAIFIVVGLILFTFAIIDSAHAPNGWKTPYIYVLFIVGCLLLIFASYIETQTKNALLPVSFFQVPSMVPLVFALFLCYGSLGIFLLYATFYMTSVMGGSPLQLVAWYAPMALGGCIISTVGGFVLHLLPGTALIITAGVAWIVAPLLFAIAPAGVNYWAYIFPAMICATIGIDITFTVANIFFTTSLSESQQGLAGSMVMLILHLGIAVCLGFSDIINTYSLDRLGLRKSYHAVFWFEVACASVSLIIMALFVKIRRAESELTVDERVAALNDVQLVEEDRSTARTRNSETDGANDGKLN